MRNIVNKRLERIVRHPDYLRATRTKNNAVTPGLILQSASLGINAIGPGPRVGFTVSKKVGNAVARNRVKRRLRAVAQVILLAKSPKNLDLVIIGRQNTLKRPFSDLVTDLKIALKKIQLPKSIT